MKISQPRQVSDRVRRNWPASRSRVYLNSRVTSRLSTPGRSVISFISSRFAFKNISGGYYRRCNWRFLTPGSHLVRFARKFSTFVRILYFPILLLKNISRIIITRVKREKFLLPGSLVFWIDTIQWLWSRLVTRLETNRNDGLIRFVSFLR